MNRVYLDNAATTAIDSKVMDAMLPFIQNHFGNPSSIYSYGREAKNAVEQARKTTAELIGSKPSEVFFTSGGTESTNTAILKSILDLECKVIITSPIEHHATLHSVEYMKEKFGITLCYIRILPNGHIDLNHFEDLLNQYSEQKILVTLMHANNEIGNLLDLKTVSNLCEKYQALLHVDMVQTIGHYPIKLSDFCIHFASSAGHKFHGPKGIGLLYINEKIRISPLLHGGSQERNMRAGTENIYGIVGYAEALKLAYENYETEIPKIKALKDYAIKQFKTKLDGVIFHGDISENSLYTVLNIGFPKGDKTDMLIIYLDMKGICVSGGSACSSGVESISHVIKEANPTYQNISPMRISFSKYNNTEDIDQLISEIIHFLAP